MVTLVLEPVEPVLDFVFLRSWNREDFLDLLDELDELALK